MSTRDEYKREWWVLFPYQGLSVVESSFNPEEYLLFDDVAILHRTQVWEYLKNTHNLPDNFSIFRAARESNSTRLLTSSYLAVRTRGPEAIQRKRATEQGVSAAELIERCRNRAYEVGGLLTLVILAHWRLSQTCGLVEALHDKQVHAVLLQLTDNRFHIRQEWVSPITALRDHGAVTFRMERLKELLSREQFGSLTNLLDTQTREHRSFVDAARQAIILLSTALFSAIPSLRLVSAFTALELFVGGRSNDRIMIPRLVALLGWENARAFDLTAIVKARNDFIHEGKAITDATLADSALTLGIAALFLFANVAPAFENKAEDLEPYLDWISKSESVGRKWSAKQNEAFRSLLRHDTQGDLYPYIQVDEIYFERPSGPEKVLSDDAEAPATC